MAQIKFCSQCGAPLTNANANFCSQCGYKFERIEEVAAPAVETPAKNIDGLVKNSYYAKYSKLFGIIGLCISAIMGLMLPIVMILISENYYLATSYLSLNGTISQVLDPWSDISFFMLMIVTIPIIASFVACYYLRRFADSQTAFKAMYIRKIALGVCITIVGWMLSLICSHTCDPFLPYYSFEYNYYGESNVSFLNLLGVAISLLGVLLVWINLKKLRSLNLATEGAQRFVELTSILTLIVFIILAAEFVMEFIFKCCVSVDIVDYDGALVVVILYTLLHLAIFAIVGVISLFAIISLSKSAPMVDAKEYCEVEARVTESNSPKSKLTRMLYIFAGISLACCAMYTLNFIGGIAYDLDIFYSINFTPVLRTFGRFGMYIPLIAIAVILLANKTPNRKKSSLLGIIFMLAGGFTMLFLNVVFGYVWYGDFATILFVNGGLALAAGYFLYIWTAECDILSKIIITAAALCPLSNNLTALMDAPYAVTALHAMLNQIVCAAAYIYVIIRLNGRENVIAKWRELI